MRPNRRPASDLDYVTRFSIVVMLRQRIRNLFQNYRKDQKSEKYSKPIATSYIRNEIRKANQAIKILNGT